MTQSSVSPKHFVAFIIETRDTIAVIQAEDETERDVLDKVLTFIVRYLATVKCTLSYLFQR